MKLFADQFEKSAILQCVEAYGQSLVTANENPSLYNLTHGSV